MPMLVVHDVSGSALVMRPGLMPSTAVALLGVALADCHTRWECAGQQPLPMPRLT